VTIFHKRKLERVVQLTDKGLDFTFRVDHDDPVSCWRVESAGRVYRSHLHVSGNETAGFFRALADAALKDWDAR